MWKTLASGAALVAASAFAPASGGTLPLNAAISAGDITLVRDGCGRGFRFSNRRQACVPIDGAGYVDPGDAAAAAAAATALGVLGVVVGSGNHGGRRVHGGNRQNFQGGNRGGNRQNFQGGNRVGQGQGVKSGNRGAGFAGPPNAWKKPGTGIK
jgi:hypothetical protein